MADKKITKLLEGQELSEELVSKLQEAYDEQLAETVEVEVAKALTEQKEQLEEDFTEKVEELQSISEAYIADEVMPTLSRYATAAVHEWLEENESDVTAAAKVELAEGFMRGLTGLMESQQLTVDVEQYDALEKAKNEAAEVRAELDEVTEKQIELSEELNKFRKEKVVGTVCAELSESQRDKIAKVAESLNYRDDEQFAGRVKGLVEDYGFGEGADLTETVESEKDDVKTVVETTDSWAKALADRL